VLDHVYAVAGVYTVTVDVKDVTGGSTGRSTVQVTVVDVPMIEPLSTPEPPVTPATQPHTGVTPWTPWTALAAGLLTALGILLTRTTHRKHHRPPTNHLPTSAPGWRLTAARSRGYPSRYRP
ncbi:MAG: hypothetical protein LBK59_05475, partial [Bifidobacteriaceae bacterium]|jgi:hypothetical protein|nr:hypothetical protein [Bifidobacteriaceae bacterium]